MKSYVVTKRDLLGIEPVAVFSNWDAADMYCEMRDEHFDDPTKAIYDIKTFTCYSYGDVDDDEEDEDCNCDECTCGDDD